MIAGGRDFDNYQYLSESVDEFINKTFPGEEIVVVSGTARGADKLVEVYAESNGYVVERYPADWNKYGRSAGFRRNEQMMEVADAAIMFWDGESHGTKHDIELSQKKGIPYEVKYYKIENETRNIRNVT